MPELIHTFFSLIEQSDNPTDESLRTFKWGFIDDGNDDEDEDELEDDEEDSSC